MTSTDIPGAFNLAGVRLLGAPSWPGRRKRMSRGPHRGGPRTRKRLEALRIREQMLKTGRTKNITVEAVRAQTRLNERDRALRRRGGPGVPPLEAAERIRRIEYAAAGPTWRQLWHSVRMTRGTAEGRVEYAGHLAKLYLSNSHKGITAPKGYRA